MPGCYFLTCGIYYGHEGGVNGTASIAMVDETGTVGAAIVLNEGDGTNPRLPALADDLICDRVGS